MQTTRAWMNWGWGRLVSVLKDMRLRCVCRALDRRKHVGGCYYKLVCRLPGDTRVVYVDCSQHARERGVFSFRCTLRTYNVVLKKKHLQNI